MLLFLLPGLYLSDILYGVLRTEASELSVTPGVLIRGAVFCVALLAAATMRIKKEYSLLFLWVFSLMLLGGLSITVGVATKGYAGLPYSLTQLIKVLYAPVLVFLFLFIYRTQSVFTMDAVRYLGYVYYVLGTILFLMQLLGIGGATYGDYAFGHKGVFLAQNDISLSLAVSCIFASHDLIRRPSTIKVLFFLLASIGTAAIGTRTGVAAPIVLPLLVLVVLVISKASHLQKGAGLKRLYLPAMLITALAVGGTGWVTAKVSGSAYDTMKWQQIQEGEFPRAYLAIGGIEYIQDRGRVANLLGEGAYHYETGVMTKLSELKQPVEPDRNTRTTEVDPIDLVGGYGWVFSLVLFSVYIAILAKSCLHFLWRRDSTLGVIALALGLFIGHALFAGHALVTPIVGTPIAAIIALYLSHSGGLVAERPTVYVRRTAT